ncbi:MAG: hypothetical protein H6577_11755 [Lewinellaceae bacterium]|nr:hypothetical protein [Saprospiraceae bacterium]MCB9338792.1 hypothetical protein [Lewinellaceae bacterium]
MPIDSSKQIFHIRLQQGCGNPETIGTLDNVLALRAGGVELLQVDRTGGGQFSELVILTGKEYVDPSDWPPANPVWPGLTGPSLWTVLPS